MTTLERRLHNPLLLVHLNKDVHEEGEKYIEFKNKLDEATKLAPREDLVYSLYAESSVKDCGMGGFVNSGFIPYGIIPEYKYGDDDFEDDLRFFWPKNAKGKPMAFLGGINLQDWPIVFHKYTADRIFRSCNAISFAGGFELLERWNKLPKWLYFFADDNGSFDSFAPDCHVRMVSDSKYNTINGRGDAIKKFMSKIKPSKITTPDCFFKNPILKFEYDGCDGEIGDKINEHPNSVIKIYGAPESQQDPCRYLSPNSYGLKRACTPLVCFNDFSNDTTHQFYVDTISMHPIEHTRAYCKLESSMT